MTEKRLHFNEYGVLTAKLFIKSEGKILCPEFINEYTSSVLDYYENEFSTSADSLYNFAKSERRRFRPLVLSLSYITSEKVKGYIKTAVILKCADGTESGFEEYHRVRFFMGKEFYKGQSKRKRFAERFGNLT